MAEADWRDEYLVKAITTRYSSDGHIWAEFNDATAGNFRYLKVTYLDDTHRDFFWIPDRGWVLLEAVSLLERAIHGG